MKKYNQVDNNFMEVIVSGSSYSLPDGTPLVRLETWGCYGKKVRPNRDYLSDTGKEFPVHGMDGATGMGWGGRIIGYCTEEQFNKIG